MFRWLINRFVLSASGLDHIADAHEELLARSDRFADRNVDVHTDGALAMAAGCLAAPGWLYRKIDDDRYADAWPTSSPALRDLRLSYRAPTPRTRLAIDARIQELAHAGALLATEIDRLERVDRELLEKDRAARRARRRHRNATPRPDVAHA